MESWFKSAILDDDGVVLKVLIVFVLLVILLLLLFGPPVFRLAAAPVAAVRAAPGVFLAPGRTPGVKTKKIHKLKATYLTTYPAAPPMLAKNITNPIATPAPLPPGGGILHKIAFTSNRANGRHLQLYMMDANGQNLERLLESDAFDRDPHFSYDGTRLAFSSNRTGTYQIYVLELGSRAVTQITTGGEDKTNPFWSPNGQQLLFTQHWGVTSQVCIMNADGSKSFQLTHTKGQYFGYGFSSNGSFVSIESDQKSGNQIFLLSIMDQKPITLVEDELTFLGNPVFSPAGHKMMFTSNYLNRGLRQLYVYDLDWKKYQRVTEDDLDKDYPIFSPDGTKIAYTAKWENAWNIFIMDVNGEHVRNLTKSYYDNQVPTWR